MTESFDSQLLEGARNLARNAGIKTGQRALIHAERNTDPVLVGVLVAALSEIDIDVSVLTTRGWNKFRESPPDVLVSALAGVDALISTGPYLNALGNFYLQALMYDEGKTYIHNEASSTVLLASEYGRFPLELLAKIGDYVSRQISGRLMHVTSEAGTDLTMSVRPETIGGYWYPFGYDVPGHKKGFPGGAYSFHPHDPVDGVLAIEAFPPDAKAPQVFLDKPLRLTFKDHRVVHMEGDCAEWLSTFWREHGDENSSWLGKAMFGLHPKAQSPDGRGGSNPHLVNFGMGNSVQYGGPAYSKTWIRGYLSDVTVTADDELVMDAGRLCALNSEELRSAAADMGCDPSLLDQVVEKLDGSSDLGGARR